MHGSAHPLFSAPVAPATPERPRRSDLQSPSIPTPPVRLPEVGARPQMDGTHVHAGVAQRSQEGMVLPAVPEHGDDADPVAGAALPRGQGVHHAIRSEELGGRERVENRQGAQSAPPTGMSVPATSGTVPNRSGVILANAST